MGWELTWVGKLGGNSWELSGWLVQACGCAVRKYVFKIPVGSGKFFVFRNWGLK